MRFLPFRTLLVLVVFPPVMYILALQGAESALSGRYRKLLDKHVPGDTHLLLDGRVALTDVLQTNIGRLYNEDPLLSRGVLLTVVVRTTKGRRIFPPVYREPVGDLADRNPIDVASRNYGLLNEGLVVDIDVKINQNTLVANVILATCLMVSLAALGGLYRRGSRKLEEEEEERILESRRWHEREEMQRASLMAMKRDNADLLTRIGRIQSEMEQERNIANRNEEELFEEMVQLEQQLQAYLEQQRAQENLIVDLEDQLKRLTHTRPQATQQNRSAAAWNKRFVSLYKDTIVTNRAVKGFTRLSENLQIKAEEVVQQLNAEPEAVSVKRKLFQRKGRSTVLEVVFARKGRLYFRRNKNRQVEVLAIGTKNDQWRDLGFLDRQGSDIGRHS